MGARAGHGEEKVQQSKRGLPVARVEVVHAGFDVPRPPLHVCSAGHRRLVLGGRQTCARALHNEPRQTHRRGTGLAHRPALLPCSRVLAGLPP